MWSVSWSFVSMYILSSRCLVFASKIAFGNIFSEPYWGTLNCNNYALPCNLSYESEKYILPRNNGEKCIMQSDFVKLFIYFSISIGLAILTYLYHYKWTFVLTIICCLIMLGAHGCTNVSFFKMIFWIFFSENIFDNPIQ